MATATVYRTGGVLAKVPEVIALFWVVKVLTTGMLGPAGIGLPLAVTTGAYFVLVLGVLAVWYRNEGTLSVHSITNRRREAFYWLTVLSTFALGTAAGDLTAIALHLGYLPSAVLFGAAMVVPWALHRCGLLNGVAAFGWPIS
jgi:uncharacterized membrane-anchored protein